MTIFLALLNLGLAWYGYRLAMESFESGKNGMGWAMLVASSWNMAALLNLIF